MARGVNKAILVGNVGRDPETRYAGNGNAVTNISVATSESWKDKQTGEQKEKTEWHNVVFFGRLAEIAGEYLKKGSQVYIEGKMRTESYEKDGVTRYVTKVYADELQMLGGRQDSDGGGQTQGNRTRADGTQRRQDSGGGQGGGYSRPQGGGQQQQRQAPQQQTAGFDDDDIPF